MFKKHYQPSDIRKALDTYSRMKSFRKASKHCGIGKSTIQRWWSSFHCLFVRQRWQKKRVRRKRTSKFTGLEAIIHQLFQSDQLKFLSLRHIQQAIQQVAPSLKPPCISWLAQALKKSRISRRRFQHSRVCGKSLGQMKEVYSTFRASWMALEGHHNIVCLDETAFANTGNSSYGYFTRGKNPIAHQVPRREKCSVIMAIHPSQGILAVAKQSLAFNKETFIAFLKDSLIPSLPPGTEAILMDNISFHHSKETKELLKQAGVSPLYIPPYSPRCNPIEEVFSQLKRIYRTMDLSQGSFNQKVDASIASLKLFKDMTSYYRHARDHVWETCLTFES